MFIQNDCTYVYIYTYIYTCVYIHKQKIHVYIYTYINTYSPLYIVNKCTLLMNEQN